MSLSPEDETARTSVVVVGDATCGKSSLIQRILDAKCGANTNGSRRRSRPRVKLGGKKKVGVQKILARSKREKVETELTHTAPAKIHRQHQAKKYQRRGHRDAVSSQVVQRFGQIGFDEWVIEILSNGTDRPAIRRIKEQMLAEPDNVLMKIQTPRLLIMFFNVCEDSEKNVFWNSLPLLNVVTATMDQNMSILLEFGRLRSTLGWRRVISLLTQWIGFADVTNRVRTIRKGIEILSTQCPGLADEKQGLKDLFGVRFVSLMTAKEGPEMISCILNFLTQDEDHQMRFLRQCVWPHAADLDRHGHGRRSLISLCDRFAWAVFDVYELLKEDMSFPLIAYLLTKLPREQYLLTLQSLVEARNVAVLEIFLVEFVGHTRSNEILKVLGYLRAQANRTGMDVDGRDE